MDQSAPPASALRRARERAQAPVIADPAHQDPPGLRADVERERMRQHVRGNALSAASGFLPIAYTGFVLHGLVPGRPLLTWCLLMAALDVLVCGHAVSYFFRDRPEKTWNTWKIRLTLLQALKGTAWGALAIWMPLSPEVKMYVFAILSAVQAAGMSSVMQYHAPVIAFSVSTWLVTLTMMLTGAPGYDVKFAAGIPVLVLSINFYLWESSNQFLQGLRARFRADALSTQLGQQAEANYELATRDDLTGLLNRRAAMTRLHQHHNEWHAHACPPGTAYTVLVLDVDHFKQVNDRYGHPAGDDVLLAVATRIRHATRPHDTLARVGGEEFMVLLPSATTDTDPATPWTVAERIRHAVEATPIHTTAGPVAVTVSIGAAQSIPHLSAPDLFALADQALYRAKNTGRNRTQLSTPEPGNSPADRQNPCDATIPQRNETSGSTVSVT